MQDLLNDHIAKGHWQCHRSIELTRLW